MKLGPCMVFSLVLMFFSLPGMQTSDHDTSKLLKKRSLSEVELVSVVTPHKKIVREDGSAETPLVDIIINRSGRGARIARDQNAVFKTIVGFKHTWKVPEPDSARIAQIVAQYKVLGSVAQTLLSRGHMTDSAIEHFIFAPYDREGFHPSLLKNALTAVMRIESAIAGKEPILICGDYDVDGMTSSTLLMRCLEPLGARISYKIPNRLKDGYGLKVPTIDKAAKEGYKLLITVDNGITAWDPAKRAKELGVDLIITDHHLAHDVIPDAYTIVNPNQPGCTYPSKSLAGVGVAFKLMSLLYERGYLGQLPEKAYELMMLGTIADVVPQEDENRHWIRRGLDGVNRTKGSLAFQRLARNANLQKPRITSTDIAFGVAPQLNAVGRLADANQGVLFLLERSPHLVNTIGDTLKALNGERKKIQHTMYAELKKEINNEANKGNFSFKNDHVIVASGRDWHPGVNGLVASKAVEKYHKPTFIFTEYEENGESYLKGSARTINGFNVFEALKACSDLLIAFGGHLCAAGLTMKAEHAPALKMRLEQFFEDTFDKKTVIGGMTVDGQEAFTGLTPDLISSIENLAPFGNTNPQPVFLFENVQVAGEPEWMGKYGGHVKCALKSGATTIIAKFFFKPEMFYTLLDLKKVNAVFKLIGTPDANHWNGRSSIEINAVDIEKVIERDWTPPAPGTNVQESPSGVHVYTSAVAEPVVDPYMFF